MDGGVIPTDLRTLDTSRQSFTRGRPLTAVIAAVSSRRSRDHGELAQISVAAVAVNRTTAPPRSGAAGLRAHAVRGAVARVTLSGR